jgi:hypothetical protein
MKTAKVKDMDKLCSGEVGAFVGRAMLSFIQINNTDCK